MTQRFISLVFALMLPVSSVQAQESFTAPRSDIGMELLVDLLTSIFNVDLEELTEPRILKDEVIASDAKFTTRKVEMRNGDLGRVNVYIKAPNGVAVAPAVVLLPGLNTKASLLDQVTFPEQVVQVMVEYPFPATLTKGKLIQQAIVKAAVLQLQTAAILNWVKKQHFVDNTRISVVSVSYGTFLAPFAIRLAQIMGFEPYALVFAYGGSDLKSIILPELEKAMSSADFDNIKKPLNRILDATSPSQHLPHLNTQTGYLVLSGAKDEVIPSDSTKILEERLPDPKEIIKLDTSHIGMNRPETIQKAFETIQDWLKKQGAF